MIVVRSALSERKKFELASPTHITAIMIFAVKAFVSSTFSRRKRI